MKLAILSVAFPFASVGTGAVGGAEQVLTQLDRELTREGHSSTVVAREDSRTAGTLVPTPVVPGLVDGVVRRRVHREYRAAIESALGSWSFDAIHMHGIDFDSYLPQTRLPILTTLHCPVECYSSGAMRTDLPNLYFNCVSTSQRRHFPSSVQWLPEIPNGVSHELSSGRFIKKNYAVTLGRICPEKNFHAAIDAAKRAGIALALAGTVFPYEAHQRYVSEQILPRLDSMRRLIGRVDFAAKRRLLASARCLLVPSLIAETSSLVAMEALACGTPVIAYPSGALPEIVEHGKTGFLVNNEKEMAKAINIAESIDSETCRRAASERFSLDRMVHGYFEVYRQLARKCP